MIQHYKNTANIGILVGLVVSIAGQVWSRSLAADDLMLLAALAVVIVGTAIFVYGCVQYALAKGRSGWWGLLGLLSLIGLIGLVLLKDYADERRQPRGFPIEPVRRR